MDDYKISIIIPLYNTEQYIARCMNSILAIDLPSQNFEIIVVDDGSTDNSVEVVKKFTQKYNNIYLYQQKNQGSSVARNLGISKASGDYFWCIDSDDYILSENFKQAYHILKKEKDLDILSLEFYEETNDKKKQITVPRSYNRNKTISGKTAIIKDYAPGSICGFIINTSFFKEHKFKFYPGITHQDSELSYQLMAFAKKVFFADIPIYIYYQHSNSTTHYQSPQRIFKLFVDDLIVIQSFLKLAQKFKYSDIELANKINRTAKSLSFSLAYRLFRKRNYYKKIGIYQKLQLSLKEANTIPLKPPYKNWKIQIISILLNLYYK